MISSLLSLLAALAIASSAEQPLNVVVLDICTARVDHMGFGGYSKATTPGMDKVAKESVVFTKAWAQSSWCLPNYASLFTGHTPEVHGQYTNIPFRDLPSFETTLAEKMKEAGYRTGGFTGGVYFLPAWGLSRGFDHFQNDFSTAEAIPGRFADSAPALMKWMEKDPKKPFFAYATVDDLHAPYQGGDPEALDPGYEGVVHSTAVRNIRFYRAYNGEPLPEGDPLNKAVETFKKDPRALAHLTAHYDAAIMDADKAISAFIAQLKKKGLWDKTVVIITGDHGELLGEQGLLGHTEGLYEGVLHVPMVVHHPRYPGGKKVDALVQRIDLMPTILEVGGASAEGLDVQGKSLVPLIKGSEKPGARRYAFASNKRNMAQQTDFLIDERAVRDERWKLLWQRYKGKYQLYDLQNDPLELEDVADQHPEVVSRLSFELLARAEETRSKTPGPSSAREAREVPTGLSTEVPKR